MPSLLSSDTVTLHMGSSLPAPTAPNEVLPATGLAGLVRVSGGKLRGGPLRLVVGLAASVSETVTGVQVYLRREGTWRRLAVPGTETLFASLALSTVPVEFVLELVGDAQDLRIAATTAEDKTYTVTARRLDEVS